MKKYLLILACACLAFAACDPEQQPGSGNGTTPGLGNLPDIGGNGNNKPTKELAPDEQQEKLQSVGQQLLAEFPAESFQNLADIAEAFDETYGYNEDYDMSALEEWAENSESVAYSYIHKDSYENNGVGYSKTNLLLLLSNHTGLFTFGANKVTVAPYEGTKAVFTVKGKTYEAEITSSGKVTTAYFEYKYHSESKDEYDYDGDGVADNINEYIWDSETKVTLGVPENINISITENGTPLATVKAKFSVNVAQDEFQFSTDAFAAEFTATVNGYELKVSKTGYDGPASKAQAMATLSGNGKALLTWVASADLRLKTDTVTGEFINGGGYYESHYSYTSKEVVVEKFENFKVAMDILGEVQVVGTCSDVNKINEEIEAVYDALRDYDRETGNSKTPDETTAQKHLDKVNDLLDFGVYYDKGSNKQADIDFEYHLEIHEDEWDTWASYNLYPVIVFTNGNKNKIEDFFTENAFSKLIESVDEFIDSYATVFGFFMEKEESVMPDYNYGY